MRSSTWQKYKMEEVYAGFWDGPHATPKESQTGPIYLGIKNVTEDGHLNLSEIRHIAEEDFPTWTKRVVLQKDDIVFSYEATLHRYAIIPEGFQGCLGRRLACIRANPQRVIPHFLYYYFLGPNWRKTVSNHIISGATVDRIPLIELPDFEVDLPDILTQEKIASVLSAYDDLIENNTRRIQILEEMAQAIYREWFVHFRFPGHEGERMVESEIGEIPERWKVRTLFDVADVMYGYPFNSSLFSEEEIGEKVIRIRDIPSNFSKTYTSEKVADKYLVQDGDLLIGMDGFFHMGIWPAGNAFLNQRVVRLRARLGLPINFLLFALKKPIADLNSAIVGTTVAHLGDSHLKKINILIPDQELIRECKKVLDPYVKLIIDLRKKNDNLRKQRDLLLPRLISGELDVDQPMLGGAMVPRERENE